MATAAQLRRIAQFVDRVTPLGGKARGMRVESAEWNTLVDVILGLLQIDREQGVSIEAELESGYAAREHEHLGEVGVSWLDSELKDRLASGGDGVGVRATVAQMQKTIQEFQSQLSKLSDGVDRLRREVQRSEIDELDRGRKLTDFERRFDGLGDLRVSLERFGGEITRLRPEVDRVLELRGQLQDGDGQPIDLTAMRARLGELDVLSERLRGVDGELSSVRDLEVRLAEVAESVGAGASGALEGRIAGIVDAQVADLRVELDRRVGQLGSNLRDEQSQNFADFEVASTSRIADLRAELTTARDERIAAIESRFDARIDERFGGVRDELLSAAVDAGRAEVERRLTSLPDQVRTAVAAARVEMESTLRSELTAQVGTQVQERFSTLQSGLTERISGLETAMDRLGSGLEGTIRDRVADELESLEDSLRGSISERLDEVRDGLAGQLREELRVDFDRFDGDLGARIEAGVATELEDLDARVSRSVEGALASLPELVSESVREEVAEVDVAGSIGALREELTGAYRSELRETAATLRSERSSDREETLRVVRGEIESSRRSTLDAARAHTDERVEGTRTDLRREFTTDLTTTREDLTRLTTVVGGLRGGGGIGPIPIRRP